MNVTRLTASIDGAYSPAVTRQQDYSHRQHWRMASI